MFLKIFHLAVLLYNSLLSNIFMLATIAVAWLICDIAHFYWKVYPKYPRGPFPLPIFGNAFTLLASISRGVHTLDIFLAQQKVYGTVFTLWIGKCPLVVIADPDLVVEVLNDRNCTGRPSMMKTLANLVLGTREITILTLSDLTKEVEFSRKITTIAARNYSTISEHAVGYADAVDIAIDKVKKDTEFCPLDLTSRLGYDAAFRATFGIPYDGDNEEHSRLYDNAEKIANSFKGLIGTEIIVGTLFAVLPNFVFRPMSLLFSHLFPRILPFHNREQQVVDFVLKQYTQRIKIASLRDDGGDFMDSIIQLRLELERRKSPDLQFLSAHHIAYLVTGALLGGNSNAGILSWWFLYCAKYPDMQDRMRREVEEALPSEDDIPTLDMRDKCPYVQAFLREVLRNRVNPLGVGRETYCDISLEGGKYKIPAKTTIFPIHANAHMNSNVWENAEQFNPARFLVTDTKVPQGQTFNSVPAVKENSFFVPFTEGRRTCPGKKMALATLFLTICRILQKTKGYRIVAASEEGIDLSWDSSFEYNTAFMAKQQNLKLVQV